MADNENSTNRTDANANDVQNKQARNSVMRSRRIQNVLQQINGMLGRANLTMYGTDRRSEIDALNNRFYNIMNTEVDSISNAGSGDTTSFLAKLYYNDRNEDVKMSKFNDAMNGIGDGLGMGDGSSINSMSGFLDNIYRNRLMEQSDLHQVSSQLIELQEAILITRDAIISADVVEGRLNRTLSFGLKDEEQDDLIPIVEQAEEKFKLREKIKNFIVPYTLEYGEYFVYIIPYSKLFSDFMRNKRTIVSGGAGIQSFGEATTLFESATGYEVVEHGNVRNIKVPKVVKNTAKINDEWIESMYTTYMESVDSDYAKASRDPNSKKYYTEMHDKFVTDAVNIMDRVEICNDPVDLPFLEEGVDSVGELYSLYVEDSGSDESPNLKRPKNKKDKIDLFSKVNNGGADGIYNDRGDAENDTDFSDIKDVYMKMIEPTKIIPVEIMDEPIAYYLVYATETTHLNGLVSEGLTYRGTEGYGATQTFIDEICEKIVKSFNKPFLEDNAKFKKLIVEAINFYNLNENRVRFQFVPAEYIQVFKVDEDENGHGQSIVKKSLFYAKMYLMLLMFKIMTIVMNSNDTKVNYVKQSGLQKDVANKIEEIIRRKQSRQINMYDLYNYSTLINKIGMGSEMYVPTGRSGERPIETEILAGQDVQLNGDLLEMLKNAYILGTGVPAAIVNYLNEPEFAKVAEQNNSKFNGRVVNYQLDFNPAITEFYKKVLRWGTNIDEENIEKFVFTLKPPKNVTGTVQNEMLQAFQQTSQYLVQLFMGEQWDQTNPTNVNAVRNFTLSLASEQLPSLNIQHAQELWDEAQLSATEDSLKPNPANQDNGLDIDLDTDDMSGAADMMQ